MPSLRIFELSVEDGIPEKMRSASWAGDLTTTLSENGKDVVALIVVNGLWPFTCRLCGRRKAQTCRVGQRKLGLSRGRWLLARLVLQQIFQLSDISTPLVSH